MTTDQRIDQLCGQTTSPAVLNALHACRTGHPLGHRNPWKFRNLWALVSQHTVEFLGTDTDWLRDAASAEAAAEGGDWCASPGH
jgi:hypothetical protein